MSNVETTDTKASLDGLQKHELSHLSEEWWCFLITGVLLVIAGMCSIAYPLFTSVGVVILLGGILVIHPHVGWAVCSRRWFPDSHGTGRKVSPVGMGLGQWNRDTHVGIDHFPSVSTPARGRQRCFVDHWLICGLGTALQRLDLDCVVL